MDRDEFLAFADSLRGGSVRADYSGLTVDRLLEMAPEEGRALASFLESRLDEEELHDEIMERCQQDVEPKDLLLHVVALVPGCAEQFGAWLDIAHYEEGLFLREARRLVVVAEDAPVGPVEIATPHEGRCPFCTMQLVSYFDLDLRHPDLAFLEIEGDRLTVAACYRCVCYGTLFTELRPDGTSTWHPKTPRPSYLPKDGPDDYDARRSHRLGLGARRRTPYEAHGRITWGGTSQLGGYPTWIQEPAYPECPTCAKKMRALAQVENSAVWSGNEGMSYAFVCRSCRVCAASYQQS